MGTYMVPVANNTNSFRMIISFSNNPSRMRKQPLLVVALMATSAVSSYYYLQLAGIPIVNRPDARTEGITTGPSPWPRVAALVFGIGILLVPIGTRELMSAAETSTAGSWLEPAQSDEKATQAPTEDDDLLVATAPR